MSGDLFREEAVIHRSSIQPGTVHYHPATALLFISTGLVIAVLVTTWLVGSSSYARKHRVTGRIDNGATTLVIADSRGKIEGLLPIEGQRVIEDQFIGSIVTPRDGRSPALAAEIEIQIRHWEATAARARKVFKLNRQAHQRKQRQAAVLETLTRQEIQLQISKVAQLEAHQANTRLLHEQGHLSNLDWINLNTGLITEQQRLTTQREKLIHLQRARTELDATQVSEQTSLNTALAETGVNLSALNARLIELNEVPYQELRAPVSGKISRLEVSEGDSVQPGQPILYIDGLEQTSSGTVFIPPRIAGHLHQGQSLQLEMDAFPAQTYGRLDAVITHLSNHTIEDRQQSLFVARVDISAPADPITLLPGMTFNTHIVVERKTLFLWLLKPVSDLADRFR